MPDITLTPAYGRDYKSLAAICADLKAGKDFIFNSFGHPYNGKPCSIRDLMAVRSFRVRYGNGRKVAVVTMDEVQA